MDTKSEVESHCHELTGITEDTEKPGKVEDSNSSSSETLMLVNSSGNDDLFG